MSIPNGLRGPVRCTAAMTILGASVPVSGLVLDYPTLTGQAVRYALAAFAFAVVARLRPAPGGGRLRPTDRLRLVALAGTGLVGFNILLLTALRHADPASVGTVVGATPLFLAILGPLLARRRPAVRLAVAALVVIVGGALVHGGGHADLVGLAAAAGAMLGEVLFSLLAVPLLPKLGALRVSGYACAVAVPMLGIAALASGEFRRLRAPTVVEAEAYLCLGTLLTVVAFLLWYSGLARLGPERAGLFAGLLPVVTLVTAAALDRRLPDPAQTAGVLVVATGLVVGLWAGRDRSGPPRRGRRPRASGKGSDRLAPALAA